MLWINNSTLALNYNDLRAHSLACLLASKILNNYTSVLLLMQ